MLINEFDLDVKTKSMRKTKDFSFYWFQTRKNYDYVVNEVIDNGLNRIFILFKQHQKGIYRIMPNFDIVIK